MKKLDIKIDVCPECPYYDEGYMGKAIWRGA